MHLGKAVRSATSARASPANRETGYFSLTSTCVDTRQDAWKSCLSPYLPLLLAWFALGRLEELVAFAEDGVDGLRRAGVQAEPAGLDAAGRIELVGRRRQPGPGRAYRNANRVVGAPVGVADQVISLEHHGFDSFEQGPREELEDVLGRRGHAFSGSSAARGGSWPGMRSRTTIFPPTMCFSMISVTSASVPAQYQTPSGYTTMLGPYSQ